MSKHPTKPHVTVTNRKTGETSLLEQGQGKKSRQASAVGEPNEYLADISTHDTPAPGGKPTAGSAAPMPVMAEDEPVAVIVPEAASQKHESSKQTQEPRGLKGSNKTGKSPGEIETLEQFIEHAYGRKGQRVTLSSKIEKRIASNARLDDDTKSRMIKLAETDEVLAIPRQLLLLSRDINGYPQLSQSLRSFVLDVMRGHAVFADQDAQAALLNNPEAPPATEVVTKLAAFNPRKQEGTKQLKEKDLASLRRNAANLFVTWLAINRSMNQNQLTELLYQAVWRPALPQPIEDNLMLRLLTEVEETATVGLVYQRIHKQMNDARSFQDQARRETDALRAQLSETEAQRRQLEAQRVELKASLEDLKVRSAEEISQARHRHEAECTHLRHDREQLGGRLVHQLDDAVAMLEVGLSALRNKTPRVEVMLERAEHVVDALRAEIKKLKEE